MKQKDLILIIVVSFISCVLSLVLSNFLISPSSKKITVSTVPPITTEFATPDTRYFNANSVDLTQLIQIKENTNPLTISSDQ